MTTETSPDSERPTDSALSPLAAMLPTMLVLLMSCGVTSQAADVNVRRLPKLYSFYQDDALCSQHSGEARQVVTWNGRTWHLMAPVSLVSPPSETKRNGTPLDVKPLSEFVTQAQKHGAVIVSDIPVNAAEFPVVVRLVMLVHDLVAEGPGTFSLQTIVAVRLCGASEKLMLAAAPTPVISGGLKTVIVTVMRREIARFSDCRHQASGMWSLAL